MAGTEDQITISVNASPVKRHEAAFIAEGVQIISEVGLIIAAAQLARRSHDEGRRKPVSFLAQNSTQGVSDIAVVVLFMIRRHPASPCAARLQTKLFLQVALVRFT